MLALLIQSIYNIVDSYFVAQYSLSGLTALSIIFPIQLLMTALGTGTGTGLNILISRMGGNGDTARQRDVVKSGLYLGIWNFLIFTCIGMLLIGSYYTISSDQAEVRAEGIQYAQIIFLGSFGLFMESNCTKLLQAKGNMMTPMLAQVAGAVINLVFDPIFIFGLFGAPELGLTGAGISTLASRIGTFLIFFLLFTRGKHYRKYLEGFRQTRVNRTDIRQLARLGLPVGFQMGVETASFSLSVIMMGWIGSLALAAYQIANVVTTLGFMVYYGIGAAVAIRVSVFVGRGDRREVRNAAMAGLRIGAVCALCYISFLLLTHTYIGYLFTPETEVVRLVSLFCWFVMVYQFGDGMQIVFANALRGLRDVRYTAGTAFFCHICLALPIGYFCGFVLGWGAAGVWCGFPVSLTTQGLLLCRRFFRLTKV